VSRKGSVTVSAVNEFLIALKLEDEQKKEAGVRRAMEKTIECFDCGHRFKMAEGIAEGPSSTAVRKEMLGCPECHASILALDTREGRMMIGC